MTPNDIEELQKECDFEYMKEKIEKQQAQIDILRNKQEIAVAEPNYKKEYDKLQEENSIRDKIKEKYTRYLHCETDIIGLTLEEAIFVLKTGERKNYVISIVQEACKVILSDYKRVLKENEELKRNYKILKDDIEDERIVYIDTPEFEQRYISVQKVKDKIEELKKQDKEWTEELSEPDSNFKIIDRNLKRIKNQIEILQELIESEE